LKARKSRAALPTSHAPVQYLAISYTKKDQQTKPNIDDRQHLERSFNAEKVDHDISTDRSAEDRSHRVIGQYFTTAPPTTC
jgi:hypothetical protein